MTQRIRMLQEKRFSDEAVRSRRPSVFLFGVLCLVLLDPAGASGRNMELLAKQSAWAYVTERPSDHWFAPDYRDVTWQRGRGGFGLPGTPGGVVQTEWVTRDIWLRQSFTMTRDELNAIADDDRLVIDIAHDDDAEVYLNGREVFAETGYTTQPKAVRIKALPKDLLREGINIVAVHCWQDFGGQFIDLSLGIVSERVFTVLADEMTDTPISSLLYSQFIELGYGIQVEPMWGEMLFNRSFEPFRPYKDINVEWFDLWNDPRDHTKGYKTDWSGEDWYHSGYEHNPWFVCPGEGARLPIDEKSTFIIARSPNLDVVIRPETGGSGHGVQCIRIVNAETKAWGGIAQEGKVLHKDQDYLFRGRLRSTGSPVNAELRMYPEGEWHTPIATVSLNGIASDFTERSARFNSGDFEGRATFSLWFPPGTEVVADDCSLMPLETYHGWRPEAVEVFRRVNPGVVRFPGGCFASFYDWHKGVGPFSERTPQDSYFWGGYNYNDVGVAELATLCAAAGAKMMYCVNVYHPLKEHYDHYFSPEQCGYMPDAFPQFTDIEQGAREAADLVAYCNLPAGSHPMADLRASHGYREPFGIRFWEMDNEVHRWFAPEDYARAVVIYAKAMKAVDPSIRIGLVTYGGRPGQPHYALQLPNMLAIAGHYIDFLADRRDSEEGLDQMLAMMRTYNAAEGTGIRYCNTEWLAYEGAPDALNRFDYNGEITKSFMFSKWYYALNVAKNLLAWQRRGSDVLFVNFSNLANTHSQSVMETPKEGAYLTAAGRVYELMSRSPAKWCLVIEDYRAHASQDRQVQAAWDADRKGLVLFVVNRTAEPWTAHFDLAPLKRSFGQAAFTSLEADGPLVMNILGNPDAIRRRDHQESNLNVTGLYHVSVPAFGFTQVVLQ